MYNNENKLKLKQFIIEWDIKNIPLILATVYISYKDLHNIHIVELYPNIRTPSPRVVGVLSLILDLGGIFNEILGGFWNLKNNTVSF